MRERAKEARMREIELRQETMSEPGEMLTDLDIGLVSEASTSAAIPVNPGRRPIGGGKFSLLRQQLEEVR